MTSKHRIAPIVLTFLVSFTAHADDTTSSNWYIGGALGNASTQADNSTFSQSESAGTISVYGGYEFTESFSIEVAAINTGDVANDRSGLEDASFFALTFTPKFNFSVSNKASLYAKAGISLLSYYEEYDAPIAGVRDDEIFWADIVPTVGIGVQYDIKEMLAIRLSYDYMSGDLDDIDDENDSAGGNTVQNIDAELSIVTIGLQYQF